MGEYVQEKLADDLPSFQAKVSSVIHEIVHRQVTINKAKFNAVRSIENPNKGDIVLQVQNALDPLETDRILKVAQQFCKQDGVPLTYNHMIKAFEHLL